MSAEVTRHFLFLHLLVSPLPFFLNPLIPFFFFLLTYLPILQASALDLEPFSVT